MRGRVVRAAARRLAALAAFALLLGLAASATAQARSVRFEGRVQWIAGQTMAVQLNDGLSVSIELRRVPQSDYHGLAQGEPVIVTGVVTTGHRRVIGTSVQRNYLGEKFQAP